VDFRKMGRVNPVVTLNRVDEIHLREVL
jgi:hypothetical protein